MDMIKAIIQKDNIEDTLLPKLILTITYIKNNQSAKALQDLSSHNSYTYKLLNLAHLQILNFIDYVFPYKGN